MKNNKWKKVVCAYECDECECCGEPYCNECNEHYADCKCPGPTMEPDYEYKTIDGVEYAREL